MLGAPVRIQLVCPAPPGSRLGNRVTALRWARILRSLGHRVRVATGYGGDDADLLVALHAWRSAGAVRAFRIRFPRRPIVVALTGTDLYHDLGRRGAAARSLELADRLVLLQEAGRLALPRWARWKARVIHQSVTLPPVRRTRVRRGGGGARQGGAAPGALPRDRSRAAPRRPFDVCVLAHLRTVKDPLRAALAARGLPAWSRIRVVHLGRALEPRWAERARAEERRNPRYHWLGDRSHPAALRRLARCRLAVVPSRLEGGANVIGEAATLGVPILASHIHGNIGLLGGQHPGLFPVGATAALRGLLLRAERDAAFYARLKRASARLAPRFSVARERRAWRSLLREIA